MSLFFKQKTAYEMRISDWSSDVCSSDLNPRHYSSSLTAVMVPPGTSADHFRKVTLEHFDMSLGSGLSQVADKVFRIGHLGDLNDLMLMSTLSGVEMGLELSGIP